VDTKTNSVVAERSQHFQSQLNSPLDSLIDDLRQFRDGSITKDRRRRSAIIAGQVLILALEYQAGRRPSRRTLKGFFYLLGREAA